MDRILLENNSVIIFKERPEVEFVIDKIMGKGASCVVYHAVCSDNTEHLLKEYYPKHIEVERTSTGEVVPLPKDKEAFEQGLLRFQRGCNLQSAIRLSNEGLKNFTCNVQGYYKLHGTEYIDMTCFNGQTYDNVQEESVYNLARRMRTLAQVVGNYHKAGLLHLDIKPENIYVRPENETVEDVMLFDFDSVVGVDDVIAGKALSCTKIWAAPEQLLSAKRRTICPATDLFAIGEIIFVQLFGRHSSQAERRSFVRKYDYDYEADIFKDVNPKVFALLDELLSHTICGVVGKRYQSADELINILDAIINIANPKEPYLKSSLPVVQNFFVGREDEIEEIHQKLNESNILFLNGIGGIGKSELAKNYARTYEKDYDVIIFAPYVNDVNMLLQDDGAIPVYNFSQYPGEQPAEYCARKLRKLQELCDERTLFIIDNLDSDEDPNLSKLLGLGCKLLITTRIDFSDYGYGQQIYLDTIRNRAQIRYIFDEYYTKELTDEDNLCVEQLIDFVAGHIMTIELLAKQMVAGRVKPGQMLAKLQEGGICESGKEKVRIGKDGVLSAQSAYAHIQTLFDLSELNEKERYVLANLSLIPHTGISAEMFQKWCELQDFDCINNLIVEGWVRWEKQKDYLSLHKVVGNITINILKQKPCLSDKLWENSYSSWLKLYNSEKDSYARQVVMDIFIYATNIALSANIYTRQFVRYLSSHLWVEDMIFYMENSFHCVRKYYEKAINICDNYIEDSNIEKANAYANLGLLYAKVGDDLSKAEELLKYAISLYNQESNYSVYKKALFYNYLGEVVSEKLDLTNGVYFLEKAIELWNKCDPIPYDRIAGVYNNLAILYQDFDLFDLAEENYQKALDELINAYGEHHRDTASVYNNFGTFYEEVNKFEEAKKLYLKALGIRESILGDSHDDTAGSYYWLASLSLKTQNYKDAKKYAFKALKIRKKIFGENTRGVANLYVILADCYAGETEINEAEKFYKLSLEIIRKISAEDSADVALVYNNMGLFYKKHGMHFESEKMMLKASKIYENIFGEDQTDTAWSYFSLGLLYKEKGEYTKAKLFIEKAYSVFKKALGEEHPKTIMIKKELF